ncbi:MAG TPA: ABC transporter permease, partial [Clostridia bacterium]
MLAFAVLAPSAVLFIALGILIGSLFSDKAVGGVASIIVNLAAILGGMFFPLRTMKGAFAVIAYIFPFAHAIDLAAYVLSGQCSDILKSLLVVTAYAAAILAVSLIVFK